MTGGCCRAVLHCTKKSRFHRLHSYATDFADFFRFFGASQQLHQPLRHPLGATRAGSSDGFRRADAQWRGWRAAMRPRATSVDYNVKEQVIRSRIKRSSQRAVSRETVH
jgi:hypothetical protein